LAREIKMKATTMTTAQFVYVGIKGSVVALNRATGQQVWVTRLKGSDFVNVLVQNGVVLASCSGEIFSLDALTGIQMWTNPLRGFGLGLATLAVEAMPGDANPPALAEKRRRDQAAAASAAC
jgi:outer membrane protein assembly factor BamB